MDDKKLKKILNKGGSVDLSGNRLTGHNIKLICNYISGDVNGKKDITELNLSSSGIDSNQAFDIVYAMEENLKPKLNKLDISNNELVNYEKVTNYANRPGQLNNLMVESKTPPKVKQNKMKNLKRQVSGMLNKFAVKKSKSSNNVVAPNVTRSRSNFCKANFVLSRNATKLKGV